MKFVKPMAVLTALLFAAGIHMAFLWAPEEKTMGEIYRIFYLHVPSFWTAAVAMTINALACLMYIFRHSEAKGGKPRRANFWDSLAAASAEVGLVFCTGGLWMGPMWAKPVWGIWWTWDARLTLTFLTWLMYIAYLLLRGFLEGSDRRGMISAVFGIFAVVNLPMVYMSNRWYRTQHPQPVMGGGEGSGLNGDMWITVGAAFAATLALMFCYLMVRFPMEQDRRRLEVLRRRLRIEDAV